MPLVTVDEKTMDVAAGTRLTIAIERAGVEIGHRCGGKARCTTCRVVVHEGEPSDMTRAEFVRLREAGLLGSHRLSCQLVVEGDMRLSSVMTKQNQEWLDTGPQLDPDVKPEPDRFDRATLEAEHPG